MIWNLKTQAAPCYRILTGNIARIGVLPWVVVVAGLTRAGVKIAAAAAIFNNVLGFLGRRICSNSYAIYSNYALELPTK